MPELISDESCRENQNVHYMYNIYIFFENRVVYEIMWSIIVDMDRPQMIIWATRIECWITKAIHTHTRARARSQYVTLFSFPLQQYLHESASMLLYTYISCLVEC